MDSLDAIWTPQQDIARQPPWQHSDCGHAEETAEQKRKLQHYSDYPRIVSLLPATIDTFRCMAPRLHTLLENIASLGCAQRVHLAATHIAGHAVGSAEQRKLQHYSDFSHSDYLLPAAIVTCGCMAPRLHCLIEKIASLGYARRENMLPAEMGMPAAHLSFCDVVCQPVCSELRAMRCTREL
eukprot:SM001853S03917  [mRNA]  locus=s1853:407:1415:+ [translate_table: standard]